MQEINALNADKETLEAQLADLRAETLAVSTQLADELSAHEQASIQLRQATNERDVYQTRVRYT